MNTVYRHLKRWSLVQFICMWLWFASGVKTVPKHGRGLLFRACSVVYSSSLCSLTHRCKPSPAVSGCLDMQVYGVEEVGGNRMQAWYKANVPKVKMFCCTNNNRCCTKQLLYTNLRQPAASGSFILTLGKKDIYVSNSSYKAIAEHFGYCALLSCQMLVCIQKKSDTMVFPQVMCVRGC